MMDPTETLRQILYTMLKDGESDKEHAAMQLRDLADWLERDGAMPDVDRATNQANGDFVNFLTSRPDWDMRHSG
jgi:hypothetical protein